jgi:hypothetical protein
VTIRDRVRKRANGRCEKCGVPFNRNRNKSNASMHHRQPRRRNGYDSVGNLLHLCLSCHSGIHRDEENAEKYGWITWSVPEATPVLIQVTSANGCQGNRWVYLLEEGSYEFLDDSEAIETIDWLLTNKQPA